MKVAMTTIDPILRVRDICDILKISERAFYRARPLLEQHGLLIEVHPQFDSCPRYAGEPFVRLLSDNYQAKLMRNELRAFSEAK